MRAVGSSELREGKGGAREDLPEINRQGHGSSPRCWPSSRAELSLPHSQGPGFGSVMDPDTTGWGQGPRAVFSCSSLLTRYPVPITPQGHGNGHQPRPASRKTSGGPSHQTSDSAQRDGSEVTVRPGQRLGRLCPAFCREPCPVRPGAALWRAAPCPQGEGSFSFLPSLRGHLGAGSSRPSRCHSRCCPPPGRRGSSRTC